MIIVRNMKLLRNLAIFSNPLYPSPLLYSICKKEEEHKIRT